MGFDSCYTLRIPNRISVAGLCKDNPSQEGPKNKRLAISGSLMTVITG